jgi:hypothetical protein
LKNNFHPFKIVYFICLVISAICLLLGYLPAGGLQVLAALTVMAVFGFFTRRSTYQWPTFAILTAYLLIAAGGLLAGLSPYLLIIGSVAALCAWDLALFDQSLVGDQHQILASVLEKKHLQSLGLVALLGLILVIAGLQIRLTLPFGVIVLIVLLALFGLERNKRYFNQSNK